MFDGLAAKYGSLDGYLQHHGIDAALREHLRRQLLEAA
jgi:protein tyrosine/serine phosphatase